MHTIARFFAALAIGSRLVIGQTCNTVDLDSCLSAIPDQCTDDSCRCTAFKSETACFTSHCATSTPTALINQLSEVCAGAVARTVPTAPAANNAGPGITGTASQDMCNLKILSNCYSKHNYTCKSDDACACEGIVVQSTCYTSYCSGSVPTDVVNSVSHLCTGQPYPSLANPGGLSQPAKIGVGIGAGVGGALVIAGVILLLFKSGLLGSRDAAASAGAGGSRANAVQLGDIAMARKLGLYRYTPDGEAEDLTSSAPGYGPAGGETSQVSLNDYGSATGAEAGSVIAHGDTVFTTGTESAHYTPARLAIEPTGTEGANFSAPGTAIGRTGTEDATFSAPEPIGTESGNFSASGDSNMGHVSWDGESMGTQAPLGSSPPNEGYLAVAHVVTATELLSGRKPVGASPSSPSSATEQLSAMVQPKEFVPTNMQHELVGEGEWHGSELGVHEASFML